MKYIYILASLVVVLSGCAINPAVKYNEDIQLYIAENRPKALAGSLKWTTFYEGGLAIANQIPPHVQGRSVQISDWNESINVAKEYEAGNLTKEEFYSWREAYNARAEAKNAAIRKNIAQCEYEAKSAAAGVRASGTSGINFDQIFKEKELFDLCMKAKQE